MIIIIFWTNVKLGVIFCKYGVLPSDHRKNDCNRFELINYFYCVEIVCVLSTQEFFANRGDQGKNPIWVSLPWDG